jgi:hypothetical protein
MRLKTSKTQADDEPPNEQHVLDEMNDEVSISPPHQPMGSSPQYWRRGMRR